MFFEKTLLPSFRRLVQPNRANLQLLRLQYYSEKPKSPLNEDKGAEKNINDHQPTENDELYTKPSHPARFSLARPLEAFILRSRLIRDVDLARFFAKAAAVSTYTLIGVSVLGTLGVDTKPLIAGIGVTGFTIGFALKEIATNFLSGVMLVLNKPFEKGQQLRVLGTQAGNTSLEGEVESIDVRYVILRTKDRGLIMVPSVLVYTSPLLVIKNKIGINSSGPGNNGISSSSSGGNGPGNIGSGSNPSKANQLIASK